MSTRNSETSEYLFPVSHMGAYHQPVLISACLLGIPCRWHGHRPKRRDKLIERLKRRYVLVPVCPEQLGGMPTPRTSERLDGTGAQVLDDGLRIIAPETGRDVTQSYINGANYALEITEVVGARRAYLKGGSPSCDREHGDRESCNSVTQTNDSCSRLLIASSTRYFPAAAAVAFNPSMHTTLKAPTAYCCL